MAPIDPLSAALVAYGVNWTLGGLFSIGGQGRALKNALGRALFQFRDRYPDFMDEILADDAWMLLQEELKLLVSADQQPDAGRLARQIAGEDEGKAQRLQASLSELLLWVRNEAALEPKLVGIQNFRIGEGIASRLADIEQALGVNLDVTELLSRGREASQADIAGFYSAYSVQDYARQAELRYGIGADDAGLGLEEIVQLLCAGQKILLEGRPGFGKSTTALRITEHLAGEDGDVVPLFMPVSEWALGRRDLFEEFASRAHFSSNNLSAKHLQFLAERKRVVLILDGWNELSGESFQWVHSELQKLLRDYATIGLIITLRPNGRRPPIKHAMAVTLLAMDIGQRDAVIRAKLGDAAERVIDRVCRQRDLDELTRIPLYLSTYLHLAASDIAPSSKEELLKEFVQSHESKDEHRLPLQEELSGLHDEYLQDLAVEMLRAGGPLMPLTTARRIIFSTGDRLIDAAQIATKPDLTNALSTLVAHHLLVATGDGNALAYSFQHQQFQEWFASRYVESIFLKAAAEPDGDFSENLRSEILNIPLWEEPILFAIKRLAGTGEAGEATTAFVIEQALQVDPILAAELIYQCSDAVWQHVKEGVIDFASRWHRVGTMDRAVGFMIATGRSEFSEIIWPLICHDDMQVRLGTLRKAKPFRVGVLGEDWLERFCELSEEAQTNLLHELVTGGGVEGIALAEEVAASEISDNVKTEVIEALDFRHAFTQRNELLANASDGIWREISRRGRLEMIDDEAIGRRLIEEKKKLARAAPHGVDRVRVLLDLVRMGVEEVKPEVVQEIAHPNFELDRDTYHVLEAGAKIDAEGVSCALVERLIQGFPLGWHSGSFVSEATEGQKKKILERILDGRIDERWYDEAASVLGQEQISVLVERFIDTAAAISRAPPQESEALRNQYWKWQKAISSTNLPALLDVILAGAAVVTIDEVRSLVELLAGHGGRYGRDARLEIPDRQKGGVWEILNYWVDLLSASPEGNRYVMSDVAHLLKRICAPEILGTLLRLLDLELTQKKADDDAFVAWFEGGRQGNQPRDARMGTADSYRRAFEAIPGDLAAEPLLPYLHDPDFGPDVAQILRHIGLRETGVLPEKRGLSKWPDFSGIRERRIRLLELENRPNSHPYVTAILDAVGQLISDDPNQRDMERAVKLCVAASGLEYGDRLPEIIEVLERSDSHRAKIGCILNLILAGEEITAELIEPGCEAAFQKWQEQQWHQDNDWWQLEDWLVLQALSDDPERLLARVNDLAEQFRHPRKYEQVVSALGANPNAKAADALFRLCEIVPNLKVTHSWIEATAKRDEPAIGSALFDMLLDDEISTELSASQFDNVFSSVLAGRLREDGEALTRFRRQLEQPLTRPVRALALHVVENLGDEEIVLSALNQISDAHPDPTPFHLRQGIEQIVTNRVAVEDWPAAYSVKPANAARLRSSLFEMAWEDQERKIAAKALLEWIDELRDEYGRPDEEPRHPNIGSERPWPML